jgi:hypothetical protein
LQKIDRLYGVNKQAKSRTAEQQEIGEPLAQFSESAVQAHARSEKINQLLGNTLCDPLRFAASTVHLMCAEFDRIALTDKYTV